MMPRFFRHIPSKSLINRIYGLMRPVGDGIWVEKRRRPNPHRAVRYGICRGTVIATNDIAYLTARGSLPEFQFLPIYSPYGTGAISEIP
jgi:hypothetical protein